MTTTLESDISTLLRYTMLATAEGETLEHARGRAGVARVGIFFRGSCRLLLRVLISGRMLIS